MRYYVPHFIPDPQDYTVPTFHVAKRKKASYEIKDVKGKVVSKRESSVIVSEVPAHSEFENLGLSCDLFTVENQSKAGVDLFAKAPIKTPFFTLGLDGRSEATEQLENFDFDSLTEKDFEEPSKTE